jgi:ABC-type Na+ efflux pump permease subunit
MYTSTGGLFGKIIGYGIAAGCYAVLGYFTFFFAHRAFTELWHHGYLPVAALAERPEFNLVLRFFLENSGPSVPIDADRIDFNLFLRFVTAPLVFLLMIIASGIAVELLATERAKDTLSSLIATPLTGRDILHGKLLASLWRLRAIVITILALWTLGLILGAVHPIGYIAAVFTLVSSTAYFLAAGFQSGLQIQDHASAASRSMGLVILPIGSGILPFILPTAFSSIIWGAASTPLVTWLSLVSYREVSYAWRYATYPLFHWLGMNTSEGALMVVLTCLIGIVAPAAVARWIWNHSIANFDRLVGRPVKDEREAAPRPVLAVSATAT